MSFEDFNPDDPFLKYRNRDGSFKWWLHTWRPRGRSGDTLSFVEYWSPLPWVWDEQPNGDTLEAYKAVGYLNKLPMGWPKWTKASPGPYPVYWALLTNINDGARDSYIAEQRKRFLTEFDLISWMNREICLFNKPKET